MIIEQMKIVCAGAKSLGMKLVGDNVVGYKFCDGDEDARDAANELLSTFFPAELIAEESVYEYMRRVEFLFSIRDEDYSSTRWEGNDRLPPHDEIECDICGHISTDPEGRHYCCEDNSND